MERTREGERTLDREVGAAAGNDKARKEIVRYIYIATVNVDKAAIAVAPGERERTEIERERDNECARHVRHLGGSQW